MRSRGSFGEVGMGLSPLVLTADRTSILRTDMVGFHGDHGRWYVKGRCPGVVVSSPWQPGDVIELGLTLEGRPHARRNGTLVVDGEDRASSDRWPIENSYPTVTFRSKGAEVEIDL